MMAKLNNEVQNGVKLSICTSVLVSSVKLNWLVVMGREGNRQIEGKSTMMG